MLNVVFLPALEIMNRLRFALKLGLIGALFVAPSAGLAFLLHGKLAAEIQAVGNERLGVRHMIPVRRLMQAVLEHRTASAYARNGDAAAKEKLAEIGGDVDKNFESLKRLSEAAGTAFYAGRLTEYRERMARCKRRRLQI